MATQDNSRNPWIHAMALLCGSLVLSLPVFSACGDVKSIDCSGYYHPVCGSDGKTYANDCYAKLADVDIILDGSCSFPDEGVFVHFEMSSERVRMYITRTTTIQDARDNLAGRNQKHIPMGKIRSGRLFDAQWSWYVDPETITLNEVTIEVCDASPSYIEQHLGDWLGRDWCPWSAEIEYIEE